MSLVFPWFQFRRTIWMPYTNLNPPANNLSHTVWYLPFLHLQKLPSLCDFSFHRMRNSRFVLGLFFLMSLYRYSCLSALLSLVAISYLRLCAQPTRSYWPVLSDRKGKIGENTLSLPFPWILNGFPTALRISCFPESIFQFRFPFNQFQSEEEENWH